MTSLEKTIPVVWPSSELKGCFLMFRWNILCFIVWPLALILSLGTTGKSLTRFCGIFSGIYIQWRNPPEPFLLQEEVSSLLTFPCTLLVLNHLHGPVLDSLEYVHVSPVPGCLELEPVMQVWPPQCWGRKRITSLNLLATLLIQPPNMIPLDFSDRGTLLAPVQFLLKLNYRQK